MARFDKGVEYYTSGVAHVPIHFPEDDICCRWCPFCRAEQELNRYWCRLGNHIVYNPNAGISDRCPIEFIKIKEGE